MLKRYCERDAAGKVNNPVDRIDSPVELSSTASAETATALPVTCQSAPLNSQWRPAALLLDVHPCPGPRGEMSPACAMDKSRMTAVLRAPEFDLPARDLVVPVDHRSGGCPAPADQRRGGEEIHTASVYIGPGGSPLSDQRRGGEEIQTAGMYIGPGGSPFSDQRRGAQPGSLIS
ncbi:unnamed protein product [Merluccius merluccius]